MGIVYAIITYLYKYVIVMKMNYSFNSILNTTKIITIF